MIKVEKEYESFGSWQGQSKHGVRFIVRASHVEGSTAEGGIARGTLRILLSWVELNKFIMT